MVNMTDPQSTRFALIENGVHYTERLGQSFSAAKKNSWRFEAGGHVEP